MKSYNTILYLLFVLLIFGTFSSMAQNSYGLKILGFVCIVFGILFLYQILQTLSRKGKKDVKDLVELGSLTILSFLFALRVFHMHFPNIEVLFLIAGAALILVYIGKMKVRYQLLKASDKNAAVLILLFYFSLIIFIVALLTATFLPGISQIAGISAFVIMVIFLGWSLVRKSFDIEGEKISLFKWISRFQDSSIILFTLFLLISFYMGLTQTGILPGVYSDDFPQAYFKLVREAETGKEKPVDGKYRHEEFKKAYDDFISRNIKGNSSN